MKKLVNRLQNSQFLTFFLEHYKASEMDLSSIAVAYYLLLTIFPFLILLANIFPYLNIDTSELLLFLRDNLPHQLYVSTSGIISNIFNTSSSGLVWVSVLTGLWTTAKSMTFLQKAINKAYDVQEHRDFVLSHAIGVLSGVILVLFLILAIFISTFGKAVLNIIYQHWHIDSGLYNSLSHLTQPLTFLVFLIAVSLLYFILPNVKIKRIRNVLPGTLFTSIVLLLTTSLFGAYFNLAIARLEDLRFFGSVAILVVMFWFIFFAKILIIGAVLNSSFQRRREGNIETRRGDVLQIIQERRERRDQH
ncbi:YihY/virulence factor BrkB family protein [Streptococcus sp. S784/96/1]|uniref:YihY/virulence factor BrkB family protein n=1 Tax=Streptococcus sp. S784/96/1 TaxID=2653499 RepID=UPI001389FC2B|nr:YihY/virulence factor BrkB family protein [Streptococcus sp. S784/96/1]